MTKNEARVLEWIKSQHIENAGTEGRPIMLVRGWVKFSDGSSLPIQREPPAVIAGLLDAPIVSPEDFAPRYRVISD